MKGKKLWVSEFSPNVLESEFKLLGIHLTRKGAINKGNKHSTKWIHQEDADWRVREFKIED